MHTIEVLFVTVSTHQSRRQAEVEALGKTIKAERHAAGMTLDDLGAAVGKHRNTVHNYEQGKQEVTFGTLVEIADALGMSVTQLARSAEERLKRDVLHAAGRGVES